MEEEILHRHTVSNRTSGEGRVVLLVHGITGDSRQWNEIIPTVSLTRLPVGYQNPR